MYEAKSKSIFNMKFSALFVVLMALIAFACAAETCDNYGTIMKAGEIDLISGECAKTECTDNGLVITTCYALPHGDKSECLFKDVDKSKPYPECCGKFTCPEPKADEVSNETE